jgi:hypothetical protein
MMRSELSLKEIHSPRHSFSADSSAAMGDTMEMSADQMTEELRRAHTIELSFNMPHAIEFI